MRKISYGRKSQLSQPAHSLFSLCSGINYFQHKKEKTMNLVDAFVKKVISGLDLPLYFQTSVIT
ncbi:hypothetical protein EXX80_22310 [Escherichia coli]|nr:hypothetical protein [Salmonella enterica subsp. enterica serovar Saintpaul]RZW20099.1 hypothetical protein EXX80_22310 [Escherichia coli]RZW56721.1 hypothetical protein EXX75_21935 [Escherichia coli]RZX37207.1 hypothetical protein EXX59_24340 [Escherichia coli]RZX63814.1 hypothetical protein EXX52_21865 [Escherichia coli]